MDDKQGRSCLVVAHNYHPAVGAAATRLQLVSSALRERGHAVTVLTSSTNQTLTGPSGERIVGTSRDWMPGSRLFRTAVLAARALVTARHHDVVVSDPPPYVALAAMLGARRPGAVRLFYFCDSWAAVASSRGSRPWALAGRLFALLESAVVRAADVTIAATPAIAQRAGHHSDSVQLVRNGTDLSVYTPDGPHWQWPSTPRRFFVYAGTMGLVHGAEVFVEAARQLWGEGQDFGMVFVGSGAEAAPIEEAAAASEGRLLFREPIAPHEVAELYRSCAGALSSMRPVPGYEDAWPVKTLAAMACGAIPVYVSGGDLADELAARDLGFVEPYWVEGAKRAMLRALQLDEPERAEMSRRCHEHALANFDQHRAAAAVAEAIDEARPLSVPVD